MSVLSNITRRKPWPQIYVVTWVLLFLAVFGFGWRRAVQNQQARSGQLKWEQEQRELAHRRSAERDRIEAHLRTLDVDMYKNRFGITPASMPGMREAQLSFRRSRGITAQSDLATIIADWECLERH